MLQHGHQEQPQEQARQQVQQHVSQLDRQGAGLTAEHVVGGKAQHTDRTPQGAGVSAHASRSPALQAGTGNTYTGVLDQHGSRIMEEEIARIQRVKQETRKHCEQQQVNRLRGIRLAALRGGGSTGSGGVQSGVSFAEIFVKGIPGRRTKKSPGEPGLSIQLGVSDH